MGNPLEDEIAEILNRWSAENASNTPDFILAQYLMACLAAFNAAVKERECWYGRDTKPPAPEGGAKVKGRDWLLKTEAAMEVHRRTYPCDGRWRRWIRTQALELPDEWYDGLWRQASAILDGRATRFVDPEPTPTGEARG